MINYFKERISIKRKYREEGIGQDEETVTDADSLIKVGKKWEVLAKSDPMWAILSDPDKMGNKWNAEEFFLTGRIEIETLMNYIESSFSISGRSWALDFGCGIGRLSLALAKYFDYVAGMDISDTMIRKAQQKATFNEKIIYVLNKSNNILFEDNKFDLIYSNIVLQHISKANALHYISEFIRVVRKDGLVVFQAPSRCLVEVGDKFESPVKTSYGVVTIDMNMIPIQCIIDAVYGAGGKIIEIKSDKSAGPKFESFKYFVSK